MAGSPGAKPPDPEAGRDTVRGGCGALFGAFVPLSLGLYLEESSPLKLGLAIVAGMILFAFLAVRFGDALWEWIGRGGGGWV